MTAPLTSTDALDRLRRLWLRGADIAVVADHPASVTAFATIAGDAGRPLPVLVDMDVGMGRTGCRDADAAVMLARAIAAVPCLRYAGVQVYWGNLQQVMPLAERARLIGVQAGRLRAVMAELAEAGLRPAIVTGGGTGSHRIDAATSLFTEIQPGSYLFMDSCYRGINISGNGNPFVPALFVAATVVSAKNAGTVVVNAGSKAMAADNGRPLAMCGVPPGSSYRFMGDEHGALDFADAEGPSLGSMVEFLTSHCDPTVNLYVAFHVVRGDDVADVWPIRARY